MAWQCLLCAGFSALWLISLLTHYNSEHTNHGDRHFTIHCGIDRCTKEYTKVNSFTKHVRSVHRKYLYTTSEAVGQPVLLQDSQGEVSSASATPDEQSSEEESSAETFAELDVCSNQSNESSISNSENDEPLNNVTRKFLCKIRGQNRLTGKAVQDIALVDTARLMSGMKHKLITS